MFSTFQSFIFLFAVSSWKSTSRESLSKRAAVCGFIIYFYTYFSKLRKPRLHYNKRNDLIREVLQSIPQLHNRFIPTPFFPTGIMQTMLIVLMDKFSRMRQKIVHYNRTFFKLKDGQEVSLDWSIPDDHVVRPDTPIIVICPGVTGTSQSINQRFLARLCASQGILSVVFHRRGVESDLTVPKVGLFGFSSDLQEVLSHIHNDYPDRQIGLVGYSAGSALVARWVGDFGIARKGIAKRIDPRLITENNIWDNAEDLAPYICGVVCNSPGYDIDWCCALCSPWLEPTMSKIIRKFWLLRLEDYWRNIHGNERMDEILAQKHISTIIREMSTLAGFKSYEEFCITCNPMLTVEENFDIPMLLLNARDDPISNIVNVGQNIPRLQSVNFPAIVMETEGGGHCGSIDWRFRSFWNQISLDFLEGCKSIRKKHAHVSEMQFEDLLLDAVSLQKTLEGDELFDTKEFPAKYTQLALPREKNQD